MGQIKPLQKTYNKISYLKDVFRTSFDKFSNIWRKPNSLIGGSKPGLEHGYGGLTTAINLKNWPPNL